MAGGWACAGFPDRLGLGVQAPADGRERGRLAQRNPHPAGSISRGHTSLWPLHLFWALVDPRPFSSLNAWWSVPGEGSIAVTVVGSLCSLYQFSLLEHFIRYVSTPVKDDAGSFILKHQIGVEGGREEWWGREGRKREALPTETASFGNHGDQRGDKDVLCGVFQPGDHVGGMCAPVSRWKEVTLGCTPGHETPPKACGSRLGFDMGWWVQEPPPPMLSMDASVDSSSFYGLWEVEAQDM